MNSMIEKESKQHVIDNPPATITLEVSLPDGMDEEQMKAYMRKTYMLDVDLCEGGGYYHSLFYNADLRSYCGDMVSFDGDTVTIHLLTRYYVPGWEDTWASLVNSSEIVESPY